MKIFFHKEAILRFEKLINYSFKNNEFLCEALSHPSIKQYKKKDCRTYERFEMLGDAILGFIITEMLFTIYNKSNEGSITKIKSHLVSKEIICHVAQRIKLPQLIIMTKGEEESGGRCNPSNIENAMEALIAAIYLDSDIVSTKLIVRNLWSEFLYNFDLTSADPKTSLQEWSQANKYGMPYYKITNKSGATHAPQFTVQVSVRGHKENGKGNSIKAAEKEAAKKLLKILVTQNSKVH